MIVQVYKSKAFAHLTRYALDRGPVVSSNLMRPGSPALAALEMEIEAAGSTRCKRPALHYALCPHPGDRIDTRTWQNIIADFLRMMGLEGHLYLATLHDPGDGTCPHAHVVVCRVRNGKAWRVQFDYAKNTRVAMRLERRYGLRRAPRGGNRWVKQEAPVQTAGPHVRELALNIFSRPDPAEFHDNRSFFSIDRGGWIDVGDD